jgi:hypothetical protein
MNNADLKHAHAVAQGLVNTLQALNASGTAVESLLVLPMIQRAAHVASDLGAFYEAQAQAQQQEGGDDPWHLFSIEAEDVDGSYTIVCSAQSESEVKAMELAEAAARDSLGEGAAINAMARLGTTDADVWVKSGPQ